MITKIQDMLRFAAKARRTGGKSILAQCAEIVALRYGPGKLGATEYYDFALYNDHQVNAAAKREYIGWRMWGVLEEDINDASWRAIANDKLVFYALMRGLSIPIPQLRAIYHAGGRGIDEVPA